MRFGVFFDIGYNGSKSISTIWGKKSNTHHKKSIFKVSKIQLFEAQEHQKNDYEFLSSNTVKKKYINVSLK